MKVLNVHIRIIDQPKNEISKLFRTLATRNDEMLATDKWPRMKLNEGLKIGSKGGHGIIRYSVEKFIPDEYIQFKFSKPKGFNGVHEFEIKEIEHNKTALIHNIKMNITGQAYITWPLAIRWLHDAFIEDAFDKVENHFSEDIKKTEWSLWVKILRFILKSKKHKKSILNLGCF